MKPGTSGAWARKIVSYLSGTVINYAGYYVTTQLINDYKTFLMCLDNFLCSQRTK